MPIFTAKELLKLLTLSNSSRTQHATVVKTESSRSHVILPLHIHMTDSKTDSEDAVKVLMIDLAGGEKAGSFISS